MPFRQITQCVFAVGRIKPEGVSLLGTCFTVRENLVATSRHVSGSDDSGLVVILPKVPTLLDYQDTSDTSVTYMQAKIHAIDPFKDVSLVSVDAKLPTVFGLIGTDEIPPGTPVITFGFPHADHGRLVLTQQNAEVGARVLIESGGIKSKHIILNTQARPGQSGSPVFDVNRRIAAMIIGSYAPGGGGGISLGGVDPHTLHQTTHAISAEYFEAMI